MVSRWKFLVWSRREKRAAGKLYLSSNFVDRECMELKADDTKQSGATLQKIFVCAGAVLVYILIFSCHEGGRSKQIYL